MTLYLAGMIRKSREFSQKLIRRGMAGCSTQPGITWWKDYTTRFGLTVRIWRFGLYWRWRSKAVESPIRILWSLHWLGPNSIGSGVWFQFDSQTVNVGKLKYSVEFLDDFPYLTSTQLFLAQDAIRKDMDPTRVRWRGSQ